MALLTQQYREEAIALSLSGKTVRQIEKELAAKYGNGSLVVRFTTIGNWLREHREKNSKIAEVSG